ncbi:MAG: hypothetical protein WBC33_00760 [Conexibacter sp.]
MAENQGLGERWKLAASDPLPQAAGFLGTDGTPTPLYKSFRNPAEAQTFSNRKAAERVTANLNTLRGPIAHCSPLADDEVVRRRLNGRGSWQQG